MTPFSELARFQNRPIFGMLSPANRLNDSTSRRIDDEAPSIDETGAQYLGHVQLLHTLTPRPLYFRLNSSHCLCIAAFSEFTTAAKGDETLQRIGTVAKPKKELEAFQFLRADPFAVEHAAVMAWVEDAVAS